MQSGCPFNAMHGGRMVSWHVDSSCHAVVWFLFTLRMELQAADSFRPAKKQTLLLLFFRATAETEHIIKSEEANGCF